MDSVECDWGLTNFHQVSALGVRNRCIDAFKTSKRSAETNWCRTRVHTSIVVRSMRPTLKSRYVTQYTEYVWYSRRQTPPGQRGSWFRIQAMVYMYYWQQPM